MDSVLLQACRELVDDAKLGCVDLVFKEICMEILVRAKHILNEREFTSLLEYTSDRMKEKAAISVEARKHSF